MYEVMKTLHVLGVVLLIGNVTVSAVWKVFADMTGDRTVMAFAQRLVTMTDWTLTAAGIALIIVGGYGAAHASGQDPFGEPWLVWGQALFTLSGLIWLGILVPAQIRLARAAREMARTGLVTDAYRRDGRRWIVWGIAATVPLVAAVYVMIAKP